MKSTARAAFVLGAACSFGLPMSAQPDQQRPCPKHLAAFATTRAQRAAENVEAAYGPFLSGRDAPGDVGRQMRELLIKKQTSAYEIFETAMQDPAYFADPKRRAQAHQRIVESEKQYNQTIRREIGETTYHAWITWIKMRKDEVTVEELGRRAAAAGEPLSAEQQSKVGAIITRPDAATGRKQTVGLYDRLGSTVITASALAELKSLLSGAQFAAAQQISAEQNGRSLPRNYLETEPDR